MPSSLYDFRPHRLVLPDLELSTKGITEMLSLVPTFLRLLQTPARRSTLWARTPLPQWPASLAASLLRVTLSLSRFLFSLLGSILSLGIGFIGKFLSPEWVRPLLPVIQLFLKFRGLSYGTALVSLTDDSPALCLGLPVSRASLCSLFANTWPFNHCKIWSTWPLGPPGRTSRLVGVIMQ